MYGHLVLRVSPPIALVLLALALPAAALGAAGTQQTSPLGSLALTVLPERTIVTSGGSLRATLVVRSTGTEPATGVRTCLLPPPQLSVARATGAQRAGRRVCFSLGTLAAGSERSLALTLRAAATRTVNVRMRAGATSTCNCSGRPSAMSPIIRIVPRNADPGVTG